MAHAWKAVVEQREGWEECLAVAQNFSDHYSMHEEQQEYVYRYAMQVPANGYSMEVGVCNGKTAAVVAHCAKKRGFVAHGVDAFILENSRDELAAQFLELDLPFLLYHARSSREPIGTLELESIADWWTEPLDLLIIDASHTDPWVSADLAFWAPLVKPGGIAMFHDYDAREDRLSPHVDVLRAVNHYTADWFSEYYVQGLLIKRKPI